MTIQLNVDHDYTNQIIDVTGVDVSTPWDILNLYSFSKEDFKLSANAEDDFAWDAPTPFDLSLKNDWYIRRHSIPRLSGGSITATYSANEIIRLYVPTTPTNFIESDIGKVVVGTGLAANATLIDFDNNRRMIWVRIHGTATTVATSTAITITAGTGAGTTSGGETQVLSDQWTGIKTIGDVVATGPKPLIYVYVGDVTTGDFGETARRVEGVAGNSIRYEDDYNEALTNADRGALDSVLVNIVDAGTTLGNPAGEIRVYARTGLDSYSDFAIDITAGGLVSIPISNAPDGEDTLGEYAVAVNTVTGTFTVGEEITENTATPTWKAEVVEVIGSVAGTRVLIIRSLTGAIADNDAFTGTSSSATGVIRGTTGGQILTYGTETDGIIELEYGNLLTGGTSSTTGNLRGHLTIAEGTTTVGYAIVETRHDNQAFPADYTVWDATDVVTGTGVSVTLVGATRTADRLTSDLDDIRIKSSVWDLTVADSSGFLVGQNVTQTVTGAKGTVVSVPDTTSIFVSQNNTTLFTGANVLNDDDGAATETITGAARDSTFDYALNLQSAFPYTILIDASGRTAAEVYHYAKFFQQGRATGAFTDLNASNADPDNDREFNMLKEDAGGASLVLTTVHGEQYHRAFTDDDLTNSYSNQDQKSRLVVSNGGALVTGQGVAIFDIASGDANNFTLVDANNTLHIPEISVTLSVTNNVIGAHLHIALDDGSGQEDKAQFTSHNTLNVARDTTFEVTVAFPNDTPLSGTIKVVDTGDTSPENREMRYRFDSWSGTTATLTAGDTGTATSTDGTGPGHVLNDTGIGSGTLQVGDPIYNITTSEYAWVKKIIDANSILTTTTSGGSGWTNLDTWESNTLVATYSNLDTAYVPYLDVIVDTATETQNLTFVSNRNIVLVHRDEDYIDVTTQGTITNTGFSFRISQTADSRYTPT